MFGFLRNPMFGKYNAPMGDFLPSADWNGTAATGFGAPYGDVPTDPTRTTAKPVCRLMVPPNQYFTDELVVGVWAGANNAGSMASNLGMTKVVAHFEGMTRDIVAPSFYNFTDVNGVARSYLGWWVTLKKPVGTAGHANVYFEAIPADATMQRRVIGPFQFSPQAALHDYSVTVAATPAESAGVRYKTLDGALNYLRGVSAVNPLITFTEAGNYDINWILGSAYTSAAYCTITASAAVTFKKPSFSTSSTARLFRNGWDGLWFRGPNITIDYKDAAYIYHENPANRPHVFEGINFIKSDGRDATFMLGTYGMQYLARDRPWYLECNISDVALPFAGADTVRGCTGSGGYDDFSSTNYTFVGNVCHDWNNGNWRTPINALTVQYSGAGTGTLEMSGGNDTAGRVLTAKVAGSSVGTFTLTADAAGFAANTNYTVQNVVTWLNTLTNWSATLLDNTRRAVALGKPGANPVGGAFSATDCKTAPLTLETVFDLHTDMWRLFTGTQENVVCADNVFYDCVGQGYWITSNGGTGLKDVIIVNNTMHQDTADPDAEFSYTQLADIQSHVVFAHNSLTQGINLRSASSSYNPDAYCLVANNVSVFINWTGTADVNLTLKDNHLFTGGTVPIYATGTTIGGVDATLFASAATGDFTPIGALLTNLKTPVVARDLARAVRATPDAAGALGL